MNSHFEAKGQQLILSLVQLVTITTNVRCIPREKRIPLTWEVVLRYSRIFVSMFQMAEAKDPQYLNREFSGFNLKIPNLSALYSIPQHIQFIGDLDFSDTSPVCTNNILS